MLNHRCDGTIYSFNEKQSVCREAKLMSILEHSLTNNQSNHIFVNLLFFSSIFFNVSFCAASLLHCLLLTNCYSYTILYERLQRVIGNFTVFFQLCSNTIFKIKKNSFTSSKDEILTNRIIIIHKNDVY